jgi:hypothetical protein
MDTATLQERVRTVDVFARWLRGGLISQNAVNTTDGMKPWVDAPWRRRSVTNFEHSMHRRRAYRIGGVLPHRRRRYSPASGLIAASQRRRGRSLRPLGNAMACCATELIPWP